MSPYASVTGKKDPRLAWGYLPENGEVDEHSRADWRNILAATGDGILLLLMNRKSETDLVDMLRDRLAMPESIASTLIQAAIKMDSSCTVECDTIFEEGKLSGLRHYENFRIK